MHVMAPLANLYPWAFDSELVLFFSVLKVVVKVQ